jgi:hypothetical protein
MAWSAGRSACFDRIGRSAQNLARGFSVCSSGGVLVVVAAVLFVGWLTAEWGRRDAVIGTPVRDRFEAGSVDLSVVGRRRL